MSVPSRYWLLAMLLPCALAASAQTASPRPTRPHRMGVPTAPSRLNAPSAYRNQNAAAVVAPAAAPAMSAQDRQAYEHCPDPRRFGPKARPKKLVRIW